MSARVIVVGGGVLGVMHARAAVAAGHSVTHLEREPDARGASLRNFGLVWVSGRAPGHELELAVRARELWEQLATEMPAVGFRANGSLTLVADDDELAILEEVCARPDAADRGFELVEASELARLNPAIRGKVLGGLYAGRDAAVEPRLVPGVVRAHLERRDHYTFEPGRDIVDVSESGAGVRLTDARGQSWDGDYAVLCTGAWHSGVIARWLGPTERPPVVRRVRLQMMQTAPLGEQLTTSVADANSLRYYPAYEGPARHRLGPADAATTAWGMQLLMVQRLDGGLTIGDTHAYDEPFDFDVDEQPYRILADRAERLLGGPLPPIERRWAGVYSELVPGVRADTAGALGYGVYFHREVIPNVHLVTGPGGRGMTLAPVIAERTVTATSAH